jgi:hypothetical protein
MLNETALCITANQVARLSEWVRLGSRSAATAFPLYRQQQTLATVVKRRQRAQLREIVLPSARISDRCSLAT